MWTYTPPLREMRFVIEDVLDAPAQWAATPAFAGLDADTAGMLAPINGSADLDWHNKQLQGARFGVQWLVRDAAVHRLRVAAREAVLPATASNGL